jgi:hypothetical protein
MKVLGKTCGCVAILSGVLFCGAALAKETKVVGRTKWLHLSSTQGDLPAADIGRQVAALIQDIDKDGHNDFVIASYEKIVWYRYNPAKGDWSKYWIEKGMPAGSLEAGGDFYDIDGDGAADLVMGSAYGGKGGIWWWKNPYPNFDPNVPWQRHLALQVGRQHHDQIFGDFDGDGKVELAFFDNGGHTLQAGDIDGDGKLDILAGEMHSPGPKEKCRTYVLYGDGKGGFETHVLATGIGSHESKLGDLNGDGRLDILQKDFQKDQRVDIWLNQGPAKQTWPQLPVSASGYGDAKLSELTAPMEKRALFGPESAPKWSPAESTVETSTAHTRSGQPALHWHVAVDHFAGEAKYPIGWPRISYAWRDAAERDWSGWDYLQLWVYTETTRAALPREPVGMTLHTPDKAGAYSRPLNELKKGEWVQIRIPLTGIPRHHDVRLVQFHISESNYRHQDQLDFYFDDAALLRYVRPTLLDFAAECAVIYADTKQMPVQFNLTGVKPGDKAEVVCELRRGGKVVAQTTVKAARGPQRLVLTLEGATPAPGEYELLARVEGGTEAAPARVRLVESPWK